MENPTEEIDPVPTQNSYDVRTHSVKMSMCVLVHANEISFSKRKIEKKRYSPTPIRQLTHIYRSHYFNGTSARAGFSWFLVK